MEAINEAVEILRSDCDGYAPDCHAQLEIMVDHANKTNDERGFWSSVWEGWKEIFFSALSKLQGYVDTVVGKIQDAVTWIWEEIIPWLAGPPMLALSWVHWQQVAERAAQTTGGMDLSQVEGAIDWQGPAARAYQETAATQAEAGGVLWNLVQDLQNFLEQHLRGLLDYLLQLHTSFVNVVAEAAKCAVQFIGVVNPLTWGDILQKAGDVVGSIITEAGAIQRAMIEYIANGVDAMTTVRQQAVTAHALPGPGLQWPPPDVKITAQPPASPGGPNYPGWHK